MTLRTVGCGAGTREGRGRPNILRVLVGDIPGNTDTNRVTVLETNLDDVSAETIGYCIERLMAEGALDAYAVPIQMKKSRPGVVLTVLCEPGRVSALERVLFAETPTFGIRRHETKRTILCRHHEIVSTTYGKLRMKVGEGGGLITASPEYEDCRGRRRAAWSAAPSGCRRSQRSMERQDGSLGLTSGRTSNGQSNGSPEDVTRALKEPEGVAWTSRYR